MFLDLECMWVKLVKVHVDSSEGDCYFWQVVGEFLKVGYFEDMNHSYVEVLSRQSHRWPSETRL